MFSNDKFINFLISNEYMFSLSMNLRLIWPTIRKTTIGSTRNTIDSSRTKLVGSPSDLEKVSLLVVVVSVLFVSISCVKLF